MHSHHNHTHTHTAEGDGMLYYELKYANHAYKCKHCGGPVKYGAKFCPQCGSRKYTWPYRKRQRFGIYLALVIGGSLGFGMKITHDETLTFLFYFYAFFAGTAAIWSVITYYTNERQIRRELNRTRARQRRPRV